MTPPVISSQSSSRRTKVLFKGRQWQILLMPRGRRRDYAYPGFTPPRRFYHFGKCSWNWHLYLFLPSLPKVGAWRLCLTRWWKTPEDSALPMEAQGEAA